MAVEQLFWTYLKEDGGLNCMEIIFRGITYHAVGDHGDGKFITYALDEQGGAVGIKEYSSLVEMLDAKELADGLSVREVLNQIEVKDFLWQ